MPVSSTATCWRWSTRLKDFRRGLSVAHRRHGSGCLGPALQPLADQGGDRGRCAPACAFAFRPRDWPGRRRPGGDCTISQRRIDPLAVDLPFQRLGLLAHEFHLAVPALEQRAPSPEVEAGHLLGLAVGRRRHADEIGRGIVAGVPAEGDGVLARHQREVAGISVAVSIPVKPPPATTTVLRAAGAGRRASAKRWHARLSGRPRR